ncbi:MAG: ferredoxin [Patescibacteria group bacterium]|nr:ferredoxin [Patescibacteria group bacterium]
MRIKIDEEKCIGCGSCAVVCPDCFEMTDNNKARLKDGCDAKCVQEAVDICPVQVIKIEE